MRPDLGLTDAATAAKDPARVWGPSGRISGFLATNDCTAGRTSLFGSRHVRLIRGLGWTDRRQLRMVRKTAGIVPWTLLSSFSSCLPS